MQKAPVIANEGFAYLVARGGIEPRPEDIYIRSWTKAYFIRSEFIFLRYGLSFLRERFRKPSDVKY